MSTYKYGSCSHCHRTDIPICPSCGKNAPHGYISGTYLPCSCGGMGPTTDQIMLQNVNLEFFSQMQQPTEERHHENCDTRDVTIPGKPCNCFVRFLNRVNQEGKEVKKDEN